MWPNKALTPYDRNKLAGSTTRPVGPKLLEPRSHLGGLYKESTLLPDLYALTFEAVFKKLPMKGSRGKNPFLATNLCNITWLLPCDFTQHHKFHDRRCSDILYRINRINIMGCCNPEDSLTTIHGNYHVLLYSISGVFQLVNFVRDQHFFMGLSKWNFFGWPRAL